MSGAIARPNPWAGAVVTKLTPIRSGRPICYFDPRFPLLELTLPGCTLWHTRAGKLWAAPPKQKRVLPDGPTQWDDIIEWDGGGPASRFSAACIEAIQRYAPELLTPLLEGRDESGSQPTALPWGPNRRLPEPTAPTLIAPGWERDR